MRNYIKKIGILITLLMSTMLFSGCGGASTGTDSGSNSGDVLKEKIKIGVTTFDNTDLLQQAINKYLTEYIGPAFNVDFIISDALTDANAEMSFLENCASSGVKGILSFYTVADEKIVFEKCQELGLYYIMGMGASTQTAETGKPYDKFLGGIGTSASDYTAGYKLATEMLEDGVRTLGVATGGKDFGVPIFVNRYNGIVDAIKDFETKSGEKVTMSEFGGFPSDAWFAEQAKMIASNPDGIIAEFSGEFLWVQPLNDAGKAGKIKLAAITAVNPVSAQAMIDGTLTYFAGYYAQICGLNFAVLYNAITGYDNDFRQNGEPIVIELDNILISSPDEMAKWLEVVNADVPPYSVEDLKTVIKVFNKDATYADLEKLSKEYTLEDIITRRSK